MTKLSVVAQDNNGHRTPCKASITECQKIEKLEVRKADISQLVEKDKQWECH